MAIPERTLDDRDGIVELDFADASALSDVDGFERRRQNGKNGAKLSKKDRAREREEIEHSWDVPGDVACNIDAVVACDLGETLTGTGPFCRACEWVGSLALASPTIGSCQDQSAQCSIRASENPRTIIHWRTGSCIAMWQQVEGQVKVDP